MRVPRTKRTNRVAIPVVLRFAALATLVVLGTHGHKVAPIEKQQGIVLRVNQVVNNGTGVRTLGAFVADKLAQWIFDTYEMRRTILGVFPAACLVKLGYRPGSARLSGAPLLTRIAKRLTGWRGIRTAAIGARMWETKAH